MKTTEPRLIAAILGICVLAGMASAAADPTAGSVTPQTTREVLAKWVETQQLLAKEKQDWQQGKEILGSRLDVVKDEIEALRARMKEARDTSSEATAKRAGATAESDLLQHAGTELAAWGSDLEAGLRSLEPRLPEPLRQKVKPLFDRIPADSSATKVSVAERYQNVVGILNEVNKFNNEITMVTEVRNLSDGKPAEVRTVYVGLAQAYFVSPKGDAGIGRPGASGWDWTNAREIASQIAVAVEVLQNKAKPQFVALPVRVQ